MVENNLKHLSRIPGQHGIHNLQRSAILGITHILRKNTSHVARLDSADIQPYEVLGVGCIPD